MPRRFKRGCLLALTLALPVCGQSGAGLVSGHVFAGDQAPLAGVEAQLINLTSAQVLRRETGSDGAFQFANLISGRYSLALVRDRYQAWRSGPFEVLPGIPVAFPPIVMRRLSASSTRPRSGLEEMALEHGLAREHVEARPIEVRAERGPPLHQLHQ
ncbi:MAG: carboxypeptidase regulatory-like domain-containing protein, partial [Acidobacteriia bacterium]|nr:carboxypeptidase regulatory-like domain-containing protein [Terriglobia bacterium]